LTYAKQIDNKQVVEFRVRYSETDQMGGIYNARVLEWFEVGRSEWFRGKGLAYTEVENRGIFLPLVEAHVEYKGHAEYDDLLKMTVTGCIAGKVRLRCDHEIVHCDSGKPVAHGYTVHACLNEDGKPVRPPKWLLEIVE
jgi:acyl-CoA thioester hydrolase